MRCEEWTSQFMNEPIYPKDVKQYRFIGSVKGYGNIVPLQLFLTAACYTKIKLPINSNINCRTRYNSMDNFFEEWEEVT